MSQHTPVTPDDITERLNSSIVQFSDILLELTALGLDQARHQPTPLQNRLLAAATTNLEAWVEIQKVKLENAEREVRRQQGGPVPPGRIPHCTNEGREVFTQLDLPILSTPEVSP